MAQERKRKSLDELTLMDDYMFATVMRDASLLEPLLERVLGLEIAGIRIAEPQKSGKEGYESKGVRLDLYAEDGAATVYSVDVQVTDKRNLPRRMRYYQSVIDVHVLHPGQDYRELRDSFVIFICDYDPFERDRCVYRFENACQGEEGLQFGDGSAKVVVNTKGSLRGVDPGLAEAVRYLGSGEMTGEYSRRLDDAVRRVKESEERRLEYMSISIKEMELREEGRAEGREEGREEERVSSIRNVMSSLKTSAEKAMEILGIPASERARYLTLL